MALEGEQLNFLEKTIKLIEKYGLWKISKALCIIFAFVFIMYNAPKVPEYLEGLFKVAIENNKQDEKETHDILLENRKNAKPKINGILEGVLMSLNADRVFVLEMHNGTNNTAGLPFIYAEMTYEVVSDQVTNVDEDYINLNLSRFDFPEQVEVEHIWVGSIDDLSKSDPKLAKRMSSNDVTYFAIAHIHGIKNELGYFGVSYCNGKEPKSKDDIIRKIMEATQKLSTLLDSNLMEEE